MQGELLSIFGLSVSASYKMSDSGTLSTLLAPHIIYQRKRTQNGQETAKKLEDGT